MDSEKEIRKTKEGRGEEVQLGQRPAGMKGMMTMGEERGDLPPPPEPHGARSTKEEEKENGASPEQRPTQIKIKVSEGNY